MKGYSISMDKAQKFGLVVRRAETERDLREWLHGNASCEEHVRRMPLKATIRFGDWLDRRL